VSHHPLPPHPTPHTIAGQLFDIEAITKAGKAAGAIVGWDLAHTVGNVPLRLHEWGVDFAVWCGYKYLNSGPGGMAGAFLHDRYADETLEDRPHLAGWWGHAKDTRFKMGPDFSPTRGVSGWQLSNPPVFPVVALRASLDLFDAAGMGRVRAKSLAMTGYLEALLVGRREAEGVSSSSSSSAPSAESGPTPLLPPGEVTILTPADPRARGAQLSLSFSLPVRRIFNKLGARGVVVDIREVREVQEGGGGGEKGGDKFWSSQCPLPRHLTTLAPSPLSFPFSCIAAPRHARGPRAPVQHGARGSRLCPPPRRGRCRGAEGGDRGGQGGGGAGGGGKGGQGGGRAGRGVCRGHCEHGCGRSERRPSVEGQAGRRGVGRGGRRPGMRHAPSHEGGGADFLACLHCAPSCD
jgi:hypothetical protein